MYKYTLTSATLKCVWERDIGGPLITCIINAKRM
jgi:hypothetical protein